MQVNITQKLTITQACLTLCVVAASSIAIFVFTADSLESESAKAAETEAYRASQEIFAQLDEDILVEYSGDSLPFATLSASTANWAIVRRNGELLAAHGEFSSGGSSFLERALVADDLSLEDGRDFRVRSLPLPKVRTSPITELPEAAQRAIHELIPGARHLRTKREVSDMNPIFEVELVGEYLWEILVTPDGKILEKDGRSLPAPSRLRPAVEATSFAELPELAQQSIHREIPQARHLRVKGDAANASSAFEVELIVEYLYEIAVTADGEIPEKERSALPLDLPPAFVVGVLGIDDGRPVPAEWRAHDAQLIAIADVGGEAKSKIAINRYGERFEILENGTLDGPTRASEIRLLVASDATNVQRAESSLLLHLVLGAPIVWLLMVGIGWFVTQRAFSPVRKILDAANGIKPSHLDDRLPTGKVRDELYSIAETINRMLDRLQAGFRRERRFTGDASHELRGPLAKIIGEIDVSLAKPRQTEEYREALDRCRSYAENLKHIVESLLLLSRLDQGERVPDMEAVEIPSVLVEVLSILRDRERRRVSLDFGGGDRPLVVLGRADLLRVLTRNLLENALRYSPAERSVTVRVLTRDDEVVIEVEDRGPGIPEDSKERVFDRFYRVDRSRARGTGGAGLGLSIVRSIVRVHRGTIDLLAADSGGTVARVTLPLSKSAVQGALPRESASVEEPAPADSRPVSPV